MCRKASDCPILLPWTALAVAEFRAILLCEDRRHERFFREVIARSAWQVAAIRTAPQGQGSAEAWVRKQYPDALRLLRAKAHQRSLCLIVVTDGDAMGLARRKESLQAELATSGQAPKRPEERVALCIPTWSIETWLLALRGTPALSEGRSYKADYREADRREPGLAGRLWCEQEGACALPSCLDARIELNRLDDQRG